MAAAALIVGVACSAAIAIWPDPRASSLTALALVAPGAVNLVHARRSKVTAILDALLLCALVLSAGAFYEVRQGRVRANDVSRGPRGEEVVVEATVIESRATSTGSPRVVVRCLAVAHEGDEDRGLPASGLAWLSWPEGRVAPRRGDLVRAHGLLSAPGGPRNPAAFDFRRYLRNRGIHAVLRVDRADVESLGKGPERAAAWVRSKVNARLGAKTGALMIGLLLGETGGIDAGLLDSLRRTGTVHVTAVSGLHVGFIVLIAYTLLRTARVPPRPARLLVLPVLAGFILLVGPRASVLRACATAASLIVSASLGRRVHPLNALGVAALVLVVARPGVVFDLGFELSFAAAAGITLLFEPTRATLRRAASHLGRVGERLADALAVSLSAQAGVAPILIAVFGEISVVAPLANLVVVPAAAFSVSSGIAMLAAEAVAPPVAQVFGASAWGALELMAWVAEHLGACRWAAASVPAAYWMSFLAAVVGLALVTRTKGHARRRVGACTVAACIALAAGATFLGPGRSYPRVIFFDVGQGDAALLEIPWRRYVLVDAGVGAAGSWRRDAGRYVVLPYLRRNAIRKLDAVVITHGHDDHYGGVGAVLEGAQALKLILPVGAASEPCLAGLVDAARLSGATVREVARGETILATPRAIVAVLGPPNSWSRNAPSENDRSLVLLASVEGARLLLTGDIERPAEGRLLFWGDDLSAEVLKIPHHGSSSSSTPAFIDAVRPELAVCSVGARNRYGHPDPAVIERFRERGTIVLRTDRDGAVVVSVRGGAIQARSLRSGRAITIPLYGKTLAPRGPTRTVAERSRSITRRAAARTSSSETASMSLANRSP